jgi:hypothetical protein
MGSASGRATGGGGNGTASWRGVGGGGTGAQEDEGGERGELQRRLQGKGLGAWGAGPAASAGEGEQTPVSGTWGGGGTGEPTVGISDKNRNIFIM